MYIRCTNGSPTVDTLDHLQSLPLSIEYWVVYVNAPVTISEQDELAIRHALLLRDRVRYISLHLPPSILQKLLKDMDKPFSILEDISLSYSTEEDVNLVLPKTFHAPNLRHLSLRIDITKRLRLLSSTVSLVALELNIVRASGYFLPKILVARLRSLPQLEELSISFSIPIPRPSAERELLGQLGTSVTLPNLKFFRFQGVSAYLECLVAQIKASRLEQLFIRLFNQIAFALPHLSRFINTTEAFELSTATVFFDNKYFRITDRKRYRGPFKFNLCVRCKELDWQIDSASQICKALVSALSGVQTLNFGHKGPMTITWGNGRIDGATWHELLRPFMFVNELRICDELSEEISRALQVDEVGLDPGLLPGLQEIVIQFNEALFGSFIHARQVAGRPVRLR